MSELPEGTMLVRNTDPLMRGQRFSRGGKSYRLNEEGRALVPEDCGIHLCGPEWVVEEGEPSVFISDAKGRAEVRAPVGPMAIWFSEEQKGQRVTAKDGSVVYFNQSGYGMAADNCGLALVPGYEMVGPATEETIASYAVVAPQTLRQIQEEQADNVARGFAAGDEDAEDDPYAALQAQLARKRIVKATSADLATALGATQAEGEGAEGEAQETEEDPSEDERPETGAPTWEENSPTPTQALETEAFKALMKQNREKLEETAAQMGVSPAGTEQYPTKRELVAAIVAVAGQNEE